MFPAFFLERSGLSGSESDFLPPLSLVIVSKQGVIFCEKTFIGLIIVVELKRESVLQCPQYC